MTDERNPKVSQRYREIGAEEPPRALDEKILAASRRAVDVHPAPLVAPAGRRRWYFPVAAAAVIMLAVAVTIQIERQKPDDEMVASAPAPAQKQPEPARELLKEQQPIEQPAKAAPAPKPASPQPSTRGFTPEPPPATTTDSMARRDAPPSAENARQEAAGGELRNKQTEVQTAPKERKAEAAVAPQAAAAAPAAGARGAPAPDARAGVLASRIERTPDRWLDEIAELRKQGKHEEADKALAEFRQRYPDYRMSDEVKAKVEKK